MNKKKRAAEPAPAVIAPESPRPRLNKLTVSNFRCIGNLPVEIELDDIVVLVGPNNAGKSAILRAYQVVMLHGSSGGDLSLEDFPNGKVDTKNLPTIELETVVFEKTAPGERWVRFDARSKEMFVRERWVWTGPGAPKKVGWDVELGDWDDEQGPWGAANVAQAYRPEPHYIDAFRKPEEQATLVLDLLSKAITERVKAMSKKVEGGGEGSLSNYEKLLVAVKDLRLSIATEATTAVADVQDKLSGMVADVFPGYRVSFDPRPEDDIEKALNLYKPAPQLKMGLADGYHTTMERQGSGTCRTLIWAALRILAERTDGKAASATDRPHLLLMDEPEICLHPNAIREARRVLYDLPAENRWQVMVTTHSPVFIDLSRNNTSIVRVERRLSDGAVHGTTIFRPKRARLDEDDNIELKMLNACDPYVAEFFFGGRTVLVEGDTEYSAFRYIISCEPKKFEDVHVVRGRGKACLVSLCKVLNGFEKSYGVLHDSDRPKVLSPKTKRQRTNSAWSENERILKVTEAGRRDGKIRVLALVPNFEEVFFDEEGKKDKPYSTVARLKQDENAFNRIAELLASLVNLSSPVPRDAKAWDEIGELEAAVAAFDSE